MADPEKFKRFLGQDTHYHDFLVFFQKELEAKGVNGVLNEYLFAGTYPVNRKILMLKFIGDERADDMLVRLFSGKFQVRANLLRPSC
jgi:hypothetical protein